MIFKSIKYFALITSLSFFAIGCGDNIPTKNPPTDKLVDPDLNVNTKDKARFQRAKIVFFALPSPIETARILQKSGAIYNKEFLNPSSNATGYSTSVRKAIALGIFVADLSYANSFMQQQDCLEYFATVQKLSEELSLSNIFTPEFIETIEKNINSEDSVLKYLSESYWHANAQLKENDRESVASLVAAGGWIEGLHFACSLVDANNPSDPLAERIAEQRISLKQLIKYLLSFKDPKVLMEMTDDLKLLKTSFDKIEMKIVRETKEVDENGIETVGSTKTYTYPEGTLKEIIEQVSIIRTKYIK
jgi:hypothetical protein